MSDSPVWLRLRETGVELAVRIVPNASRDGVAGVYGDRLKVHLTAPPVDGEANEGLQRFLGKQLRVAKTSVRIVRGVRDRSKTILIETPDPQRLAGRVVTLLDPTR
ncbi:MAG: hypothetical protein ACI8TX_000582 [Hyphomicrobiaceae bacterium]